MFVMTFVCVPVSLSDIYVSFCRSLDVREAKAFLAEFLVAFSLFSFFWLGQNGRVRIWMELELVHMPRDYV